MTFKLSLETIEMLKHGLEIDTENEYSEYEELNNSMEFLVNKYSSDQTLNDALKDFFTRWNNDDNLYNDMDHDHGLEYYFYKNFMPIHLDEGLDNLIEYSMEKIIKYNKKSQKKLSKLINQDEKEYNKLSKIVKKNNQFLYKKISNIIGKYDEIIEQINNVLSANNRDSLPKHLNHKLEYELEDEIIKFMNDTSRYNEESHEKLLKIVKQNGGLVYDKLSKKVKRNKNTLYKNLSKIVDKNNEIIEQINNALNKNET